MIKFRIKCEECSEYLGRYETINMSEQAAVNIRDSVECSSGHKSATLEAVSTDAQSVSWVQKIKKFFKGE